MQAGARQFGVQHLAGALLEALNEDHSNQGCSANV
jgi:hypothetical protein